MHGLQKKRIELLITGSDWGDPTLKSAKSGCTHGLVVSLENVKYDNKAKMHWQKSAESVNDWMEGENR